MGGTPTPDYREFDNIKTSHKYTKYGINPSITIKCECVAHNSKFKIQHSKSFGGRQPDKLEFIIYKF